MTTSVTRLATQSLRVRPARSALRQTDVCTRWGGEEFLIRLPETGLVQALAIADLIRAAVAEIKVAGMEPGPSVTASLGVAELDATVPSFERLQSQTDQSLDEAKRLGRNRTETDRTPSAAGSRSVTES